MAVDKPRDRPTVPDVLPLVRAIYQRHCAGCCLHIVTDDDNCEEEWMPFVLETARTREHPDCLAAAEMLAQMTPAQRHEVYKRHAREERA